MPGFLFSSLHIRIALQACCGETDTMRVIFLTFAAFVMLGIGATCRTPAVVAEGCERLSGNLVHCPQAPDRG
jgi:hypothetical protein